jgi:peptide/nickel transport system substrate-binding protein
MTLERRKKMRRNPWTVLLSLILTLVVVLSACGGAAEPTATQAPESQPEPTEAPEAQPEPTEAPAPTEAPEAEPNIAIYAYPRTINELDPSLVLSSETNVLWNVWGNLTLWDPDEGVIGMLADSWESNEDATVWTFHLREDAKCHDGTDLTAEAVKMSFERTIEKGALAYVFAPVDTIEAVDAKTVQINLNYAARLPELLANNWGTFIMCPAAIDQPAEWFAEGNEVGAGPYMIESYEPGQRLVLTKFEDWWQGWEEGSYDKIILEVVEDAAVRVQKLRGGEADIAWGVPFDDFDSLNATDNVKALAIPAFQNLQWHFNTRRAPLDDVRVRQALSHAFPYEAAAQGTYGGYAVPAQGAVPRIQWTPATPTQIYAYDLEQAQALLDEAGVPEGTELRAGVEVNATEAVLVAQLWQAELAKIGIDLKIEQVSAGVRWDEVYNPDTEFDIMFIHMFIGFDSPNEYLGSLWHSGWTWYPFSGFASEEFDGLVEEALALEAVDWDEADRLYQQAEQILYDEAVAVFSLDLPQDWAIASNMAGFKPNPLYGYAAFLWQAHRE